MMVRSGCCPKDWLKKYGGLLEMGQETETEFALSRHRH